MNSLNRLTDAEKEKVLEAVDSLFEFAEISELRAFLFEMLHASFRRAAIERLSKQENDQISDMFYILNKTLNQLEPYAKKQASRYQNGNNLN